MLRRPGPATIALVVWSLLVWTTRLRNIWSDDGLTTGEQWGRTALALSFTVLALGVGWAVFYRTPWLRSAVLALGAWTTGVWLVRALGIATADHDATFVIVHLALAAISITLAGLAAREAGGFRVRTG